MRPRSEVRAALKESGLRTRFYVLLAVALVLIVLGEVIFLRGGPVAEFELCLGTSIGLAVASSVMASGIARKQRP